MGYEGRGCVLSRAVVYEERGCVLSRLFSWVLLRPPPFGFHYWFHSFSLFLVPVWVFIMGFIGGWELCQHRRPNCYESQEDEGADIKGGP